MSWNRFQTHNLVLPELDFALDYSRLHWPENFFADKQAAICQALSDMRALEAGAISNPDEKRMVGHYWLRAPELAPKPELSAEITACLEQIKNLAHRVHSGALAGAAGSFTDLLVIGIGGSALGPQFVSQALGGAGVSKMAVHFFDNTDPDGLDLVLGRLKGRLGRTLAVVISKSGGTPETRNGMLEAAAAWKAAGLSFAKHAIAVTGAASNLDKHAIAEGWLERFPMWDWVGGRTSELAAVGLLPAALEGLNISDMLAGAAAMDVATRVDDPRRNPAALLALAWYHATSGKGAKDMVILPYKDRLGLFSKYLQQLIMESLGKEFDLKGQVVNQGIAVYGNKGSTDQHAYVQQLREGVANFFATFIEVLEDRSGASIEVEPGTTSGDYLTGFLLGTRDALWEKGRESLTLTVRRADALTVGRLIALYERAVGLYASLVNINAYHQPGVEAGKKAAAGFLALNTKIQNHLNANVGQRFTVEELASRIGETSRSEIVYKLLEHLAANHGKRVHRNAGCGPFDATYGVR